MLNQLIIFATSQAEILEATNRLIETQQAINNTLVIFSLIFLITSVVSGVAIVGIHDLLVDIYRNHFKGPRF